MGQKHVLNGQGNGWPPKAIVLVHYIREEMSRLLQTRADGGVYSRAQGLPERVGRSSLDNVYYAHWSQTERSPYLSKSDEQRKRMENPFNLGETLRNRTLKSDQTINMKPVNPVGSGKNTGGRGPVVPWNSSGKRAKSTNERSLGRRISSANRGLRVRSNDRLCRNTKPKGRQLEQLRQLETVSLARQETTIGTRDQEFELTKLDWKAV